MTLDRTQKFAMATGGQGVSVGDVADFVGGGGASVVKIVRVALTSAQLLSLNSSPMEILPSPGPGQYVYVIASSYELTFGTTAYSSNDTGPGLYYAPSSQGLPADNAVGARAFSGSGSIVSANVGVVANATPDSIDNAAILLMNPTDDMTDGDGTGSLTVLYSVINL